MSSDVNQVDLLTFALSEQRTIMTDPTNSVTVELTADGSIKAIRLSESGHRMPPATVAELVVSLHNAGLAQAQQAIEAALFSDADDGSADFGTLPPPAAPDVPDPAASSSVPAVDVSRTRMVEEPGLSASPAREVRDMAAPTDSPPRPGSAAQTAPPGVRSHHADAEFVAPQAISPSNSSDELDDEDEDEYFRNFSVFEQDDHRRRR